MRNLKKGFTLVELIVVITILAILGTIGFISLQGYSSDARNSKRTSDLGSISTSLAGKETAGVSILSLVDTTKNTGGALTTPSIAGSNSTTSDYAAGAVNFLGLGVKQADFQDPNGKDYFMGATSRVGGKYQLAATMEQGQSKVSKVIGDYVNRTVANATVAIGSTDTTAKTLTLTGSADIGKLLVGDTITGSNGLTLAAGTTIIKVSSDGKTLYLSGTITGSAGSGVLAAAETTGLLKSTAGNAITDNSPTDYPY